MRKGLRCTGDDERWSHLCATSSVQATATLLVVWVSAVLQGSKNGVDGHREAGMTWTTGPSVLLMYLLVAMPSLTSTIAADERRMQNTERGRSRKAFVSTSICPPARTMFADVITVFPTATTSSQSANCRRVFMFEADQTSVESDAARHKHTVIFKYIAAIHWHVHLPAVRSIVCSVSVRVASVSICAVCSGSWSFVEHEAQFLDDLSCACLENAEALVS